MSELAKTGKADSAEDGESNWVWVSDSSSRIGAEERSFSLEFCFGFFYDYFVCSKGESEIGKCVK